MLYKYISNQELGRDILHLFTHHSNFPFNISAFIRPLVGNAAVSEQNCSSFISFTGVLHDEYLNYLDAVHHS